MLRGIIMSISGREAVILTRDSEFVKVLLPEGQYDLGQEIEAESSKNSPVQKWFAYGARRWAAVAAVFLIAIVLPVVATTVFLNNAVYAYVTLDINPSTEFVINGKEKIIRAKPLNEEGAAVLEGSSLKGKDIQSGIEYFVERAYQLGFASTGDEGAVVATTVMKKGKDIGLEEKISVAINKTVGENNLNVKTGVLSATKEIREEADKAGVSAGKYLIALQASDDQLEMDIEDVKGSSIVSAISRAGGDLGSILKRARKNNEELANLFEKNRDKLRKSSNRDEEKGEDKNKKDTGGSSWNNRIDNNGHGKINGRDNNSGRDNNNGRDKSSERDSKGRKSDDNRDDRDKIRDNNRKDVNRKNNNGPKDNERDKKDDKGSGKDRRGGDNSGNNGREEERNRGRDGREKPGNSNPGNGKGKNNSEKKDEKKISNAGSIVKNFNKNRKNRPEAFEDIIKRMFNK
ncbi:MAG: anti-sigma-I factor RsgI family protein [Clostridia bacterium]|jgi:hypothetical protein